MGFCVVTGLCPVLSGQSPDTTHDSDPKAVTPIC